MLEQPSTHYFR